MTTTAETDTLTFHPLTSDRWADVERLFGSRGCGGCWCMWWKLPRKEFEQQKGEGNRLAFQALVATGTVPGILAFKGDEPVAWCAVAPRESYPALERSVNLARVDRQPVWSIVCFFVARRHRKQGILTPLILAAVEHVREQGGKIIEAYPSDVPRVTADPFVYTGLLSTFLRAGFREVARRSPTRPIVRYCLT
jgi:GNAT superfamily N-acetyltransferase